MEWDSGTLNMPSPSRMEFIKRHPDALWKVFLAILGFCVFAPGLYISYYRDDFGYIIDPARTPLFSYWTQSNLHGWPHFRYSR